MTVAATTMERLTESAGVAGQYELGRSLFWVIVVGLILYATYRWRAYRLAGADARTVNTTA